MQNVIKFSRLSRLCDACRQIGNVSPYGDGCRQRLIRVAKWRWVSPWRDIAVIKISPRRWLRHGAKALAVWRRPSPRLCNRPKEQLAMIPSATWQALRHPEDRVLRRRTFKILSPQKQSRNVYATRNDGNRGQQQWILLPPTPRPERHSCSVYHISVATPIKITYSNTN